MGYPSPVDMISATLPYAPAVAPYASLLLWASSPPLSPAVVAMPTDVSSVQWSLFLSQGINAFMELIKRGTKSEKGNQNVVEWAEHSLGSHW